MARDVGQRGDAGETRFLTDSGPVTERRSHTVVSSECLVTGPVRTLSQGQHTVAATECLSQAHGG